MTTTTAGRRCRVGINARIDPQVHDAIRTAARERGVRHWVVVEDALNAGLPHVPHPDTEGLPRGAFVGAHSRGRQGRDLFVEVNPQLVDAIDGVTAHRLHHWWVIEQALRHGLGMLPSSRQEVLPATA